MKYQHSYIQQLRVGLDNFLVAFAEILRARRSPDVLVEDDETSGDSLNGLILGPKQAFYGLLRISVTLTLHGIAQSELDARYRNAELN